MGCENWGWLEPAVESRSMVPTPGLSLITATTAKQSLQSPTDLGLSSAFVVCGDESESHVHEKPSEKASNSSRLPSYSKPLQATSSHISFIAFTHVAISSRGNTTTPRNLISCITKSLAYFEKANASSEIPKWSSQERLGVWSPAPHELLFEVAMQPLDAIRSTRADPVS